MNVKVVCQKHAEVEASSIAKRKRRSPQKISLRPEAPQGDYHAASRKATRTRILWVEVQTQQGHHFCEFQLAYGGRDHGPRTTILKRCSSMAPKEIIGQSSRHLWGRRPGFHGFPPAKDRKTRIDREEPRPPISLWVSPACMWWRCQV